MGLIAGAPKALRRGWGEGLQTTFSGGGAFYCQRAVLSLREESRLRGIWGDIRTTIYIVTWGKLHPKDIYQLKTFTVKSLTQK